LGISARRITPGLYLPASRSACSFGQITGHCSRSPSIVCPSGPGAPLFDTTFNNANVNRQATSSIVTGVPFSALTIASGTPTRLITSDRSENAERAAPRGFSAVAIGSSSCNTV